VLVEIHFSTNGLPLNLSLHSLYSLMPDHKDDLTNLTVLKMLNSLPEKWKKGEKEKRIKIVADRKDAGWISTRIYEDVDRGLLSVTLKVQHFKQSVEMDILLKVTEGTVDVALTTALTLLLIEIKKRAVERWKRRVRRKRTDDYFY